MAVRELLTAVIRAGGTLVSPDEYRRRMAICEHCNRKGEVTVLGVEFAGCTVCGCPFVTKCRADYHPLDGGKVKCPENKW